MAKDSELEKKGKWSFKSLFKQGLQQRSFRDARLPGARRTRLPPLPPEAGSTPASPVAPEAPSTMPSTPPGVQQISGTGESSQGADPEVSTAAHAAAVNPLAGRSLVVQVLQARRLRAADSNGLSDPYCVVKVGDHKASSKTELKTLEPRWNETMCFSAADVSGALQDGRPFVALRVFDWDLVSADDFLGQCEVRFEDLDPELTGPTPPRWLPPCGHARGGKKADAGEIQVAAWFETGGGQGQQDGTTLSTLCCPPGMHKQVPQVVHSAQGVLYEEPLIACLAITLDRVEAVPAHSTAGGPGTSSKGDVASDAIPSSPYGRPGDSPVPGSGGRGSGGKLFGNIFHRKRHSSSSVSRGSHTLTNSLSMRSSMRDGMIAGEDPGDEYVGLNFYGQDAEGRGEEESLGQEEDEEVPQELLAGNTGSPHTPVRNSTSEENLAHPSSLAWPSSFVAREEGQENGLSGMRMYVRLVLGRQKQTSWIKKEHNNGTANWHQTFVFAAPLPLRDRQLRVELYRTTSSTQKGRLISIANVWLRDLVPPGLAQDLEICRSNTLELESVLKHWPAGRMLLRSTLIDTDLRRRMYRAPFVDSEEEEQQDIEGMRHVQRLESFTMDYSNRELAKKALHSEESFAAWKFSRHHRAKEKVSGLVPIAVDLAQHSWQRISRYFSSDQEVAAAAVAAVPGAEPPPPAPPKLPEPVGTLTLMVHSINLHAATTSDCFFVLKCGPYWGRSSVLSMTGRSSVDSGWQLSLPVLDPSAILTLALFQYSRMKATEKLRPGFLPSSSAVLVVGKLRVRLSCVQPNMPLTADLVLLGERAKGGNESGTVQLTLQTSYRSPAALFKGYAAPRLPVPTYAHGVDDSSLQMVVSRECRRIVLRWLDSANPSIGSVEALTVLDAEREVFAITRVRVNIRRIRMALVGVKRFKRKFDAIKRWQEPWESVAAMAGICLLCLMPRLAVPLLLGWVVFSTLAGKPEFEESMLRMEQDPPDIEPENESLETTTVNPLVNLRAKVERLQRMGLLVQTILDDVASFMERAGALLSWQDPSATLGVLCMLSVAALLIFLLGLSTVVAFVACFIIRPPALRTPTPPLPAIVFGKLPTRGDRIV